MPYKDILGRTCGFVEVEEKEKSGKYMRRYLRLDKGKGLVEWFADNPSNLPKNTAPHGNIGINFITKVDTPTKAKLRAKHCFVVNTPMRKYYFQGNDDADMGQWVEALNNASKIVVSSDDEKSDSPKSFNQENENSPSQSEEFSYKTEIVAGVVVQKKVVGISEDSTTVGTPVKNEESKSPKTTKANVPTGSPKNSDNSEAELYKNGWGVKQGHLRKNWKRRFFVLTAAGFSYFRTDHEKEAIRFIPLIDILTAKKDDSSQSEHKDNLFLVATTERIFHIQADTPDEMLSWIKSFHDAIHYANSLKRRAKDKKSSNKDSGNAPVISNSSRKLDTSMSHASLSQRNSAYLGGTTTNLSVSNRLSSTDESLYRSLTPYKSQTDIKPKVAYEWRRIASSSEESSGLSNSMDSLSKNLPDENNSTEKQNKRSSSKKKSFTRSSSGTDVLSVEEKPIKKPVGLGERNQVHSYPAGESVFPDSREEAVSSSSKSRSSTRSSGSFSSMTSVKTTRSFLFDPKVDHRAAVKPSTVKKKRNTGILFSLNNVLNKKAEKMSSIDKKKHLF